MICEERLRQCIYECREREGVARPGQQICIWDHQILLSTCNLTIDCISMEPISHLPFDHVQSAIVGGKRLSQLNVFSPPYNDISYPNKHRVYLATTEHQESTDYEEDLGLPSATTDELDLLPSPVQPSMEVCTVSVHQRSGCVAIIYIESVGTLRELRRNTAGLGFTVRSLNHVVLSFNTVTEFIE